ncbi:Hypothetical predicted protein [Paramuricea clavata]|uniref:Uncharacterized protein n=1 Tax=Paramuricea clavata TaxID=317549 RepID=A0A6S7G305_PARCT|nr:Hypothetical predicted protein [Paramuricea clavata]
MEKILKVAWKVTLLATFLGTSIDELRKRQLENEKKKSEMRQLILNEIRDIKENGILTKVECEERKRQLLSKYDDNF